MIVLGIDAACAACSVAIWRDGRILAADRMATERGHAEILMPMLGRTLARAGLGFAALTGLAVTVGPGSFTGIRTAIATARGLALALDCPIVGVTTLEAIAHAARGAALSGQFARRAARGGRSAAPCLVALDTRRADLYVQTFAPDGAARTRPEAAMPQDVAASWSDPAVLLAGNAAQRIAPLLRERGLAVAVAPGDGNPDARVVAELAAVRLSAAFGADAFPAVPLYLRAPDATKPADRGRLRP